MNIVTSTDFRNQGVGSFMLDHLEQLSIDKNCSKIMLEVCQDNLNAINLYVKYDFKRIQIRKNYYNNTKDAIIMKKEITNEKQK